MALPGYAVRTSGLGKGGLQANNKLITNHHHSPNSAVAGVGWVVVWAGQPVWLVVTIEFVAGWKCSDGWACVHV